MAASGLNYCIFILAFLFITTPSVFVSSAIPVSLTALLSLKSRFPRSEFRDWNVTNNWCSWSGVKCNPVETNVISLDLSSRNLSGDLPLELGFLSRITELNLSSNRFTGPVPTVVFELTTLKKLDLSHNGFNTSFPLEVSILKNLTFLDAYSNNFSGKLPESLPDLLRNLETLNLSGNLFNGGIPKSYGGFQSLRFLEIAGSGLSGPIPSELGFLTRLEVLAIGYSSFEGRIPFELGFLKLLTYLDISQCELSGRLPMEIGNLTNLRVLYLYNNHFFGDIPRSFNNLRLLEEIDLSGNTLTGSIPEEFGVFMELKVLNLMMNRLTGSIPDAIGDLPNLQTVCLWNNSLMGKLPQRLGSKTSLVKIDVSSNFLSGSIPGNLCSGKMLYKILLFGNQFSGEIPPSLTTCTALTRMRLQNNKLNGTIPYGFGNLPNLTYMDISDNNLSGGIPKDFATGESLEFLNISANKFHTKLPRNIWSAPNMQIFSASSCYLHGEIPEFSECKNLYKIELHENSLTGSIPGDVDTCQKLISLNLRHNKLTGVIPWELSALPMVADVDLSYNSLTGEIPSNFSNCNTVENFNVSFNNISGAIPATCAIFSSLHPSSFTGNPNLCGEILINRCNSSSAPPFSGDKPRKNTGKILWILAAALGGGLFVIVAVSQWLRRSNIEGKMDGEGPWKMTLFQRVNFTAEHLKHCLSLSETEVLGVGTQGTVYKAEMPSGEIVAVKNLSAESTAGKLTRWRCGVQSEVEVLGNVRHRNIVKMIGYCGTRKRTMLLYDYMPNGSLEDLLHSTEVEKGRINKPGWMTRYKIALGVAQGIRYLHHDCVPAIVHRDLKPSNILLDADMEARVADFGVAKLLRHDEAMSAIAGSYGYIAPEYMYTMQVDEKSDIYSYGVVLLEILTGKRCSGVCFGEGKSIVDWVRSKVKVKDGFKDILDRNAGASCEKVREEMVLVLRVALLCTMPSPTDRPSMRDVVSMLQEARPQRKLPESECFGGV